MADDFTIADVLTWARTKPADEAYTYGDIHNCALCQFLRETKRAIRPVVGSCDWDDHPTNRKNVLLPEEINRAVSTFGRTFGELVARLEKLCPEMPVTTSNWQSIDAYLTDIEDVARERVTA